MTRCVKDLRELICISRLSYRSSDEYDSTTSDRDSVAGKVAINDTPLKTDKLLAEHFPTSPDSGCSTNTSNESVCIPIDSSPSNCRKVKRKRRKKKRCFNDETHDLAKNKPLPPVGAMSKFISDDEYEFDVNFIMEYAAEDTIADWLNRCNKQVNELHKFCNTNENFVEFGHFWLTKFSNSKKLDIYDLEYSILIDELTTVFTRGLSMKKVKNVDLMKLLQILFKEYPDYLTSSRGNFLFLDYLDILSSDRTAEYKHLLSDVKCSTQNPQYAQWLLGMRAFALLNTWRAVTKFYEDVQEEPHKNCQTNNKITPDNVHYHRMCQAIRLGYTDVVHYLTERRHVDICAVDGQGRSWIFHAVIDNQLTTLKYLLSKTLPRIDVNIRSDTGNGALHAAANTGNLPALQILLNAPGIDVNSRNTLCDGATPLHLAIMHDHIRVVTALLEAGADPRVRMGDMTTREVAETFASSSVCRIVDKYLTSL